MLAYRNNSCLLLSALVLMVGQSPLERGLRAFRERDFAAAEQIFKEIILKQPADARAYKFLGMVYSAQEKYSMAEEPLRHACSVDPREENACYYLGRLYFTLNRFDESRKAFEVALRYSTDRGRPLLGMALTMEALGQTDQAERCYKEAIRAGETRALTDYGMFLFHQGRGKESLEYLRKANAKSELERVTRALESAPAAAHHQTPPSPIKFEPTTLNTVVDNGAFGEKHQVETMIAGVAVFDYDNDGWPDIYIANGAQILSLQKASPSFQNRLFRNNHNGTFTDVTEKAGVGGEGYSMGVAAADYDNDGCVDLFVTGVRSNTLYHNRCNGTFEDVTARAGLRGDGLWSIAAGWFDYDRDGALDLFVARYVVWDPTKEIYCGLLKPGYRTYCHPMHYEPLPNALYHNEGNGIFRDVSNESGIGVHPGKGMGIVFGDYDGDGRLDVFVANDTVPNFLFHNEGDGKFKELALSAGVAYNEVGKANSWMGADFRDYDNDGREDLFVTALTNETFSLFRNVGRGEFVDVTGPSRVSAASLPWSGWSTGILDLNNDGFKDLFVAGGNVMDNAELTSGRKSRQPNQVFLNNGDGTFEIETLPSEAFHRGAAFGDFDRDGRVDVVVTRLNEKPLVLRNVTTPVRHWIALRLIGTQSNRDAIGAWIHLKTDIGDQWNRLTTSVGYAGSSDRLVHFGLSAASRIKSIEIDWPSGAKQKLNDIAADRYVTIEEPRK